MTEDLGPLPEYAPEFPPHFGDDGGFTGAQMRAYAAAAVAAERERCAVYLDALRLWHTAIDIRAGKHDA